MSCFSVAFVTFHAFFVNVAQFRHQLVSFLRSPPPTLPPLCNNRVENELLKRKTSSYLLSCLFLGVVGFWLQTVSILFTLRRPGTVSFNVALSRRYRFPLQEQKGRRLDFPDL